MRLCFTPKFQREKAPPPADVKEVFETYSGGGNHMGADQFLSFLAEVQGESGAAPAVEGVRHFRCRHHLLGRPVFTLDDFLHYLFSAELNPPIRSEVHQDMTAPLSHYYIYTGHNSYLTGNQLNSECSDAPIIKALKRGVRVIELDLWPNSAKDNVKVLHGSGHDVTITNLGCLEVGLHHASKTVLSRTMTKPVKLIKCLESIKEYAFCASEYPVVITLEDHLTPDLQHKVAVMVTQTFGDMLYKPKTEILEEFPAPDALKKKIIISTKLPKENGSQNNSQRRRVTSDEETLTKEFTEQEFEYNDKNHREQNFINIFHHNSTPRYKLLISIHAQKPKGRLRDSLKLDHEKVRRISLSEQKFEKAAASHRDEVVRFTQKNLIRIYPRAIRVDSSNYKPLLAWRHGAQMVAFNMQGYGRSLWLMHGFFRANGGCGYVKKPDFLLKVSPDDQIFKPNASLSVKKTLKVKIYKGDGWHLDSKQLHFDAHSPPEFFMKVGIDGMPADTKMKRTRRIYGDWTPEWDEEFDFPLTVPELALLRIEARKYNMPKNDDFGGQTCLPVLELRPGFRAVPLFDRKGAELKSVKLLVRFELV